jgi:hypothetical protein
MSQHTPGPWSIRKTGNGDRGISAAGTGVFIEAFAEIRHSGEGAYDECDANARLIAAAPELLELLVEADNRIVWEGHGFDASFQERVEAAIAKASSSSMQEKRDA